MVVLILNMVASDLGGGADWSDKLLLTSAAGAVLGATIAAGATETQRAFSEPGLFHNDDWEDGTITVEVRLAATQPALTFLAVRLHRINSSGTIQESQTISAEQAALASTTLTFTFSALTWTAGALTDRLRVDYAMRNANATAMSFRITANTTDNEVTIPISYRLQPTPVALILAAPAPTLALTYDLAPSPVALVLAAPTPTLALTYALAPEPVALVLAAPVPTVALTYALAPDPVALVLAAPAPSLELSYSLAPDPVAVVLAAPAPTLLLTYDLAPDPVALVLAAPAPSLELTYALTPSPLALVLALPLIDLDVEGETAHFRMTKVVRVNTRREEIAKIR